MPLSTIYSVHEERFTTTSLNSVVAIYASHAVDEPAIKEFQHSGNDLKRHLLVLVGRDFHTDQHVVNYYNGGCRMKNWDMAGAFCCGIWGFLSGSAFFLSPGFGPLLVASPLVGWIVGALEGAVFIET